MMRARVLKLRGQICSLRGQSGLPSDGPALQMLQMVQMLQRLQSLF